MNFGNFHDGGDMGQQIINTFKSLDKLGEQLHFVLTLLYSLDADSKNHFEPEIRKLEKIHQNLKFMRRVRRRDALVDEYAAEYYGKDFGYDDPFLYDEDIEEDISKLSLEFMSIIGRIVNRMKSDHVFISDET